MEDETVVDPDQGNSKLCPFMSASAGPPSADLAQDHAG